VFHGVAGVGIFFVGGEIPKQARLGLLIIDVDEETPPPVPVFIVLVQESVAGCSLQEKPT
jgi:hypothetical protein